MIDAKSLVSALQATAPDPAFKLRQGVIISVAADYSVTVTIGGSTTQVSGVSVAAHTCPIPGATCWLATDGTDWMVLATLAPAGPAYGSMRQSVAQSIPTGAFTAIDWTNRTETIATGVTLGATGITCIVPGIYSIEISAAFVANATGQRHMILTHNGANEAQGYSTNALAGSDITRMTVTSTFKMAIGDVVNATVFQSSTVALALANGSGHNVIRATWIGPSI